ncbi:MAG TPA: hypothetical protein VLE53_06725 [Gemmatimonadaceae bacterium]|nr:hypothetical protein [Gemmatimonadaceae bacterium]
MLAFLDSLCGALIARDAIRIRRLLAHPLARALPARVRDEADAIAQGTRRGFVAPLHTLRLYHQTAHLLGVSADPATRGTAAPPKSVERRQMELPLESAALLG